MHIKISTHALIFYIILIFFIFLSIVLYTNIKDQPNTCPPNEGFIYNTNDLGSALGLGGYHCGICQPINKSYIDDKGFCKTCLSNQYYDGNKCAYCDNDKRLDPVLNVCVCNEYLGYFPTAQGCIKCNNNEEFINGHCEPCINGMYLNVNRRCVCPNDKTLINGICQ